ncbi:MAG: hypothetical protein V4479_07895, partial [Actinomycetota bacterium]
DSGYVLVGETTWTHTFAPAPGCLPTLPLVNGQVASTQASCSGDTNSYSIVPVDGVEYQQTLDGTTTPIAPGTYTAVELGSRYTITATATSGHGLDPGYPSVWSFTFAAVGTCSLPTLSFTGISPWWLAALAGGAATIGLGTALLLITRRRSRAPADGK